ncbi:MAG: ATPase, T2SS/T4P/T4SS family [Lachnospiraceae bacterium]|nr:ATPase, T2SS/T4P/T4SS family [Lachnospiraceae bacterium]
MRQRWQNEEADPSLYLQRELRRQLDLTGELSDEEIGRMIDELIVSAGKQRHLSLQDMTRLRRELFNSVRRLDVLQELIDDDRVTEIMVNGTEGIFVERDGRITKWETGFDAAEKLEIIVQQIAGRCNRTVNEAEAIVDARLENGARVNIIMPPIALNGPIITIRRFPDHPITMRELIEWGSITQEAAEFLKRCVLAGYNIFISGGTGSGKTTFLNALSNFIPKDERIITIEDNAELQIREAENLVRLEARKANEEGEHEVTIRDLIKASLRCRPDRIIVGEVRGDETIDMLQSLNTGHDGSLSTGHGNSPKDMLSRLETMVLMGLEMPVSAIRRQIASGIDLMVHLGRMRDRTRKVLEILEVDGYDGITQEIQTHTLYRFEEMETDEPKVPGAKVRGALVRTGKLLHTGKLERAGILEGVAEE